MSDLDEKRLSDGANQEEATETREEPAEEAFGEEEE